MIVRTGYSFKTAYGKLEDVISRLQEAGASTLAIADRNSTFSFVKATKLAKKAGLKPVYGVEMAVTPRLGDKKPVLDWWTFLAKDELRPLHELVALATANPGKEPSLTYQQAFAAQGLIKIAGERCLIDELPVGLEDNPDFFLGLSPATPKGLFRRGAARGFKFLARSDNLYPRREDKELYRLALGWRSTTQTYPQWILSDEELKTTLTRIAPMGDVEDALANRDLAFDQCSAKLKTASLLIPDKPKTLRAMCEEGAHRLNINLADPLYFERLDRELELIAKKQFEDYFYILHDIISFAKARMIVGGGRGSSAGSLVCYLLGITAIDPLKYGLLFERFIDINRNDLPDIDVDFSDDRRQLVFDYVEAKYGRERVARLGTVGMFKPRSALNAVGAGLKIPKWLVERTLDGVIERSGGDSRALLALEDTLTGTEAGRKLLEEFPATRIAGLMEGHPANAGQHAAGIVLTQEPLVNIVAVDGRTKATMCDKKDAEDLNLLKIDALGLTQLSIFERTLQLLGKPDRSGFFETLPLDDQKAFDVLNQGHFAGVFQFMGGALQSVSKQFRISSIDDIIAVTALARPGPMASGQAHEWIKRKTKQAEVSYPHPLFEPYLKNTLGIIIYQEQVMMIGREIGNLSWGDVSELRKAMSKSLGVEYFNKFGDPWKKAAIQKGIPPEVCEKVWSDLCAYGAMGFNLSHAVSYGLVSYHCCWLKAHHPVEFAAATLDAEKEPMKQIALLRELADEGVEYVPFDPDHSVARWSIKTEGNRKILVGPLTQIKGVGPVTVNEILDCRRAGKPLRASVLKKLKSATTEIDTLYPIRDKLKALHGDLANAGIVTTPTPIIKAQIGTQGDIVIVGVANKIAPKDENEAVNVAKRGYAFSGPTAALNLFMRDDTDEIYCKVNRFDYERLGREIVERGRAGKAIYAIKGQVWSGFRGLGVKQVKFLGFLDD